MQDHHARSRSSAAKSPAGSSITSSLLGRVKNNDAQGWRRLVRLFTPQVYEWCRKANLQPADASDVVQEVFRAVVTGIGEFRRERPEDTFRGWLWRIAQRKVADHWRRQSRHPIAIGGDQGPGVFDRAAAAPSLPALECEPEGNAEVLHAALDLVRDDFQPQTWRAFWLVAVEGWKAEDAARELNTSRGAVYVAKSRVLRRLRLELDGLVSFDGVSAER
jgi:RNA polymerase sigma-70 factor, ECF subfamily